MRRRHWCALALAASTASCGGTTVVDDPVATESACESHADCGDGWCVGEAGCGAEWLCVDEIPCSAAAPFMACTCDGTWQSLAAGCPDRHYAYADWSHDHDPGDACDPTSPP